MASKHARKRTPAQILIDREFVADQLNRGFRPREITEKLNRERAGQYTLSQKSIEADIVIIQAEWRSKTHALLDIAKAQALEAIEQQKREVWAAWERSKLDRKRQQRARKKAGKELAEVTNSTTTEASTGNPAFMRILIDLEARKAKLLGLDAPTRIADADGGSLGGFGGPPPTATLHVIVEGEPLEAPGPIEDEPEELPEEEDF